MRGAMERNARAQDNRSIAIRSATIGGGAMMQCSLLLAVRVATSATMAAQVGAARLAPSRPIIITIALITIRVAAVAWWSSRDHYVDASVWCSPTLCLERMHECALRRRHGVELK